MSPDPCLQALNRTLVLPRFLCSCDLSPEGNRGGCARGDTALPFRCPLDFVVNVTALDASGLRYRHPSFLDVPKASMTSICLHARL